jgi:Tol biopolymer transport system component
VTSERLRAIERLFHEARERPPAERDAWLAHACPDDPTLRREVESLLAQPPAGVIDAPVAALVAGLVAPVSVLLTGRRIGVFEVQGLLGVGGMGEVYRARDTRLGREVAIKILPRMFKDDPDRLARFEREARVLASLNHPHIGAIYGLEEADDVTALVMELVEGEDLAQRIGRGALSIAEALPIARQIAEALEAAHDQGIIHRDLKPANIKLRSDGTVKVLDFGIAKVTRASLESLESHVETATMTELGAVIGTVAYMPPEQARGRVVDRRADIWAFGCVFYEMLTGKRAFSAGRLTDVLNPTVTAEPDWDALPPETPVPIRVLLRRCLQADVAQRLQHIGDARIEIQDSIAHPDGVVSSVPAAARVARWRRAAPWIVATLAIVVTIAFALPLTRGPAPDSRPVVRLELNLPPGVDLDTTVGGQSAALSADGTQVAFVGISGGVRQVYVRRLNQFDAVPLRGTEQATSCVFSPDGGRLAFVLASGALKIVSPADGAVSTLGKQVDYTTRITWGPDDLITFSRQGTLWQVPASGGTAHQLTTLDPAKRELSHAWPAIVGSGRALLFASTTTDGTSHIEALSFADQRRRVVVDSGSFPLYAPSGHLVYFRDGVLFAAPFDADRLEVTGSPVRVIENLALTAGVPVAAVSPTGSLVFAPDAAASSRLTFVSRKGAEQSLNEVLRGYRHPRLSPDGRRLVVQASGDLWIQDLSRGTFARLTSLGTVDGFMSWMPDGTRVVFRTSTGVQIVATDGSGRGEVIGGTSSADYPNSVSPDGATLVYAKMAATGDLVMLSLRGERKPFPFLATPSYEAGAQFSPDGRWVAYVSDESGQLQVYVRPFPSPGSKSQVSTDGGTQVLWSRNGKELFYRRGNQMLAVQVSTSPQFTLSAPRLLFEQRYTVGSVTFANYDVTPDGEHFVMVKEESGAGRLNVVLNWSAELKR